MTETEYLAFEETAPERNAWVNGELVAMAGASFAHSRVTANLLAAFHGALRGGPCAVLTADTRVRVEQTRLYVYPDLTIVCDKPRTAATRPHTLLNPTVVVEVLSPSTESADRGWKWQHYQQLASLRAYLLVDPLLRTMELFTRDGERWTYAMAGVGASLSIGPLGVDLAAPEVFAGLEGLGPDGEPVPES